MTPEQVKELEEKRKKMVQAEQERLEKEPIETKFIRAVKSMDLSRMKDLIKQNEKTIKKRKDSISKNNQASPTKVIENLCAFKGDENGFTPLHWACLGGDAKIIEFLLDNRADIDAVNNRGEPPIFWAVIKGHASAVRCMMERNCNLHISDGKGYNVMHHVCLLFHVRSDKYLVANISFVLTGCAK